MFNSLICFVSLMMIDKLIKNHLIDETNKLLKKCQILKKLFSDLTLTFINVKWTHAETWI